MKSKMAADRHFGMTALSGVTLASTGLSYLYLYQRMCAVMLLLLIKEMNKLMTDRSCCCAKLESFIDSWTALFVKISVIL